MAVLVAALPTANSGGSVRGRIHLRRSPSCCPAGRAHGVAVGSGARRSGELSHVRRDLLCGDGDRAGPVAAAGLVADGDRVRLRRRASQLATVAFLGILAAAMRRRMRAAWWFVMAAVVLDRVLGFSLIVLTEALVELRVETDIAAIAVGLVILAILIAARRELSTDGRAQPHHPRVCGSTAALAERAARPRWRRGCVQPPRSARWPSGGVRYLMNRAGLPATTA